MVGLLGVDGGEKIDRADTMSKARCRLNRVGNEPFGPFDRLKNRCSLSNPRGNGRR